MTIYYAHDADGAFIVGDDATGLTSYAYPTSTHAARARRAPATVAKAMLADQSPTYRRISPSVRDYDRRNWDRLAQLLL